MKKKLNEIFDEANPHELDRFSEELNAPKLSEEMLASVKDKVFEKIKITKNEKPKGVWLRFGAVAASLAVTLIGLVFFRENSGSFTVKDPTEPSSPTATYAPSGTSVVATENDSDINKIRLFEFESLFLYEQYEKNAGVERSDHYYIPSGVADRFEFYRVLRQYKSEAISAPFIDVEYKLKGVTVDIGNYNEWKLNVISCRYYIGDFYAKSFDDYLNRGYKRIEHGNVQMNMKEYYSSDGKALLWYHVIFLKNGSMISMHLPAIDTLENMLKYTDVLRIDIVR